MSHDSNLTEIIQDSEMELPNNLFEIIQNSEIELPNKLITKLLDAEKYTDLISEYQFDEWYENSLRYRRILEEEKNYNDENKIQDITDLTGEIIEYNNKIYRPITITRAESLLKLRNFLCKNLSKKQFINSLKIISKYPITLDNIDLTSDFELNLIAQWINWCNDNSTIKLSEYLENKNNLFDNIENSFKFILLTKYSKKIIIINEILIMRDWIIKQEKKSNENSRIYNSIIYLIRILLIYARKKTYDSILKLTIKEQEEINKLLSIEDSLLQKNVDYISNLKEAKNILLKKEESIILESIKNEFGNYSFLLKNFGIIYTEQDLKLIEKFYEIFNIKKDDKKNKITDLNLKPKVLEIIIDNDGIQKWNDISKNLSNYNTILNIKRKKEKNDLSMEITEKKRKKFIEIITNEITNKTKYSEIFNIYNNAYDKIRIKSNISIDWEKINILIRVLNKRSNILNTKNSDTEKILIGSAKQCDCKKTILCKNNALLYKNNNENIILSTHYTEIPFIIKENDGKKKILLNTKEIELENEDLLDISIICNNSKYYLKSFSIFQDNVINLYNVYKNLGKISDGIFQLILKPNNISVRINNLIE